MFSIPRSALVVVRCHHQRGGRPCRRPVAYVERNDDYIYDPGALVLVYERPVTLEHRPPSRPGSGIVNPTLGEMRDQDPEHQRRGIPELLSFPLEGKVDALIVIADCDRHGAVALRVGDIRQAMRTAFGRRVDVWSFTATDGVREVWGTSG